MALHSRAKGIAGLKTTKTPCPKCGSAMFVKPCPCPFKRKGWLTCAKCLNPACSATVGLVRRKGRAGRIAAGVWDSL